jgi:hypothetical protein
LSEEAGLLLRSKQHKTRYTPMEPGAALHCAIDRSNLNAKQGFLVPGTYCKWT